MFKNVIVRKDIESLIYRPRGGSLHCILVFDSKERKRFCIQDSWMALRSLLGSG